MRILSKSPLFLTDLTDRLGVLLTLTFFAVFPYHAFSAGPTTYDYPSYSLTANVPPVKSAEEAQDQDQRLQSLVNYAKVKIPVLMPGLPAQIRHTAQWALNGGSEEDGGQSFLSFDWLGSENINSVADTFRPVTSLLQPSTNPAGGAWIEPGYHHRRGVLPIHDAMMMGLHSRHNLLDEYLSIDAHPYIAQNYFSARNYYGTEITINLSSPSDTSRTTRPWGSISVNYTNGDQGLMDHGRGIDLHSELRFDDHLTLNSGLRQSDTSGASNYVLLQWKLVTE